MVALPGRWRAGKYSRNRRAENGAGNYRNKNTDSEKQKQKEANSGSFSCCIATEFCAVNSL